MHRSNRLAGVVDDHDVEGVRSGDTGAKACWIGTPQRWLRRQRLGAGSASPGSVSERAALVTLHAHADRPVSWLGQVLGLTSSGVTRLVDRLVARGWVTRAPGSDARSRQLTLSAAGRDQARAVLRARAEAMAGAVRELSEADRAEFERLLGLVVRGLAADVSEALRVCRLCDRDACASGGFGCPLVDPDGRTDRDD